MIITANGHSLLEGSVLTTPSRGVWTAPLVVDSTDTVGPVVELANFDRTLVLRGTALREGMHADRRTMLVVGGAGGMQSAVPRKGYQQISVRVVLTDILTAVGETLSASSDAGVLGRMLRHWKRMAGSAERALDALVDHVGATWRVLPDGSVYVGPLEYPAAVDENAAFVRRDDATASFELLVDAPRFLAPCTFEGEKIDTVVHELAPKATRTTLFFGGRDRMRSLFRQLVAKSLPAIDYLGSYPCRVVSQNGDGTLDLVADDARVPNSSKVKIRYGIPGVTVKVAGGAKVLLSFEGGDPERPVAALWESEGLKEITLKASVKVTVDAPEIVAQNGRPLARLGDLVNTICAGPGQAAVGQIITGNQQNRG